MQAVEARWPVMLWAAFGVLVGLGYLSIFSIGSFVLAVALLLAVFGVIHPSTRTSAAFAAIPGLGLAPLYVGLMNAGGPGERCNSTSGFVSCTELLSPWPFAIPGALLVVVGILLVRRFATGSPAQPNPIPPGG